MYESMNRNEEYIFGIIDILTEYNSRKAAEYYFKSILYGKGVSAVPPDHYAERFINFIDTVILKKYDETIQVGRTLAIAGDTQEKNDK